MQRNLQRHRAAQLNLHSRIGQVVQNELNRSGNLDHLLGNIQDDWIPARLDLKRNKGFAVIETELGKINHPIGDHVVAAGVDQNVRIGHRECDYTDSPNLKVSVDTRIDTIVATAVAAIRGGEEGQSKTDVRNRQAFRIRSQGRSVGFIRATRSECAEKRRDSGAPHLQHRDLLGGAVAQRCGCRDALGEGEAARSVNLVTNF